MTFTTIISLLRWYAGLEAIERARPREPGNHDYAVIGGRRHPDRVEDVWKTMTAIQQIMCRHVSPRDHALIVTLFGHDRRSLREVGKAMNMSRWAVLRARNRIVPMLEQVFEVQGMIDVRHDEPQYVEGDEAQ